MQTYTWVIYVMKVHYLQASQLSTTIHLITGRNISMCPPGSTRHFQQSSHGFHARILENKTKEKRTLFRGGHAQGTRGNKPKPDQQDPLGTAYYLSSEGLEGLVVTWSHLTGIQLAVNLLKSPLKLCWRRLIPLPFPLQTIWSSQNSLFPHTP